MDLHKKTRESIFEEERRIADRKTNVEQLQTLTDQLIAAEKK